ncbi:YafY family transcriptional regulator [Listeria monocytogenes]|uniref:helix-turn-helix transcriptional regulator n=1 Tax=Listeria monocytogenes TaxID=1639 RepID=UPI0010EBF4A4|nr:YafY family transcriptional regulator [Listeria monocytogenes]EAE2793839.1 YafY family transcriptional regulator [Listeria monocytogenes]EAE4464083.1 YafY family transcriptional regulator [Listeria monocytogenes]HCO9085467.1 YafY family transcriptional regulator [Listeria monocytogenes]
MKIERLLKLLFYLLNNQRVTINDLMNYLEVSRRTIFRDLDTLTLAGFPIITFQGAGGGIELMEGYKYDKSILDDEDFSNVLTALNSLKNLGDDQKVEYLINRIVPKELKENFEESDVIVDLSSWFRVDDSQNLFLDLRNAVNNHSFVKIEYHSASKYTTRTIEPYKLIFKQNDWYLLAYCMTRKDYRLFKLNRISFYNISEKSFIPKKVPRELLSFKMPSKAPITYEDNKKYQVVLEYDKNDKGFLIDILGAMNFKDSKDKHYIIFDTYALDWAEHIVISLEDKVTVLEPESLRINVANKILNMSKKYQ